MSRLLLILTCLFTLNLSGCADIKPAVDAKANIDIKTEVESLVKAHLESLIKAEIDTHLEATIDNKMNLLNADIKGKLADELNANIDSKIQANTQNVGMFSGGAIYVVILAIVFLILLFGTFVYLIQSVLRWKQIWNLVSASIEKHSSNKEHGDYIKNIKLHFNQSLISAGLKDIVDQNLQKRGMKDSSSS